MSAAWFPIIVGSIAFAGPSGMQQMWYTLYLRDKGAGMGVHLPKIKGLMHAGEDETMPSRGFMFDTEDPEEMKKWKSWKRWVFNDAYILFWGVTMLVTVTFTVLAQSAARTNPTVVTELEAGNQGQRSPLWRTPSAQRAVPFSASCSSGSSRWWAGRAAWASSTPSPADRPT